MEGFSKTFNIPLSHLDFGYIDQCTDVNELEKIYMTLKIGEEGKYPELEKCCEEKVKLLNPESRVLRRPTELMTTAQLDKEERNVLMEDFQTWLAEMKSAEEKKGKVDLSERGDSEALKSYPIRCKQEITTSESIASDKKTSAKSCKPKDYNEWSKIADELEKQVIAEEAEEVNTKNETKCKPIKEKLLSEKINDLPRKVDTAGLNETEKVRRALLEKEKGNEAYRAGDLDEAEIYYCRSLSIEMNPSVYNNRGLIYMKQKKWEEAIRDFNLALKHEPSNVKALLRRASCNSEIHNLQNAISDCQKILKLSPNNKSAEALLSKSEEELQKRSQLKLKDGKRMVITEVGSDEECSDEEEPENIRLSSENITENIISQEEKQKEEKRISQISQREESKEDNSEEAFLRLKDQGNELFKELKYSDALTVYDELTRKWPTNPIGYRNRAACNLMLERPEDVIADCTTAISLDSTSHLAFYRRGKAYKILEMYNNSLKDLEEALHISPNHKQINEELNDVKALLYDQKISGDNDEEKASKEIIFSHKPVIETSAEISNCDTQRLSPVSDTWEFLDKGAFANCIDTNDDDEENDEEQEVIPKDTAVTIETIEQSVTSLMTKAEFDKKLRFIKTKYDWKSVIQLLVDASPSNLSKLIGNKLDGIILEHIMAGLVIYSQNKAHASFIMTVMEELAKVERFCFIKMMVPDQTLEDFECLFQFLKSNCDNLADVNNLQHKYL